jgi:GMC oxidoreductase/NAD(P)-binding Rossmann-like domain
VIISFTDFIKSNEKVAKTIIIGSGPAALSLAYTLEQHGKECVLLESGDGKAPEQWNVVSDPLDNADYGVKESYPQLHIRREIGGGLAVWAGWCSAMRDINFSRTDISGYPHWPLQKEQLRSFYERAATWLKIPNPEHAWPDEIPILADGRLSGKGFSFSPPVRFDSLREHIQSSDKITLVTDATVLSLSGSNDMAQTIHVKYSEGTKSLACQSAVVLAGGAVGNARVLKQSAGALNMQKPSLPFIGRYAFEHPHCYSLGHVLFRPDVAQAIDKSPAWSNDFISLAPSADYLRENKLLDFNFQIRRTTPSELGLSEQVLAKNYRSTFDTEPLFFKATLGTEQLGVETNHVLDDATLTGNNDGHLHLDLSSQLPIVEAAKKWLMSRGSHAWTSTDVSPRIQAVGHIHGTTRMAATPDAGVVDDQCKVFGVNNLYVAGSSVFPSAGFTNPTVTIVTLAIRLGDHIAEKST